MTRFEFHAELWLHDGDAAWHFVTVPAAVSDAIEAASSNSSAGFGSVPVRVTVGATTWSTSLFPDSRRQAYLLPVKAEVRRREGLEAGTSMTIALELTSSSR